MGGSPALKNHIETVRDWIPVALVGTKGWQEIGKTTPRMPSRNHSFLRTNISRSNFGATAGAQHVAIAQVTIKERQKETHTLYVYDMLEKYSLTLKNHVLTWKQCGWVAYIIEGASHPCFVRFSFGWKRHTPQSSCSTLPLYIKAGSRHTKFSRPSTSSNVVALAVFSKLSMLLITCIRTSKGHYLIHFTI